ncbi:MAG: hypothetical protein HY861_01040 [Chlamydiia bacterium]|nr:hypothetical protein [Chlamydiia bacterium]
MQLLAHLPFSGIAAGVLTGIYSRFTDPAITSPLFEKNQDLCRAAFPDHWVFKAVNTMKQWELKTCALLTPILPLAIQVCYDTVASKKPKITSRLYSAYQNISRDQIISLVAVVTLGLTHGMYASSLGITSKTFDASGHLMLKVALASLLSSYLKAARGNKITKTAAYALGCLYALTDGVLIHNTVKACHTPAESAAGIGWGLGILALTQMAHKSLY